jgi:hypothetical protein
LAKFKTNSRRQRKRFDFTVKERTYKQALLQVPFSKTIARADSLLKIINTKRLLKIAGV